MTYTQHEQKCIDLAFKNQDIPREVILEDLEDTRKEISDLEGKIGTKGGRFDNTYTSNIAERKMFVGTLEKILIGRDLLINEEA